MTPSQSLWKEEGSCSLLSSLLNPCCFSSFCGALSEAVG